MPTTRHEELRAAITAARGALAAHPDAATAPALVDLIAAAEPFANFAPAVPPPAPRVSRRASRSVARSSERWDADSDHVGVVIEDPVDDKARGSVPHLRQADPGSCDRQPLMRLDRDDRAVGDDVDTPMVTPPDRGGVVHAFSRPWSSLTWRALVMTTKGWPRAVFPPSMWSSPSVPTGILGPSGITALQVNG
ncbi:hypothetical protein [Embleya sp. NPDC005575]|uniref:hypothetical protein n=1 Tax=Embleya sp. NPDC005575 TaxID=3156892 RepID=UPI0033A05F1E